MADGLVRGYPVNNPKPGRLRSRWYRALDWDEHIPAGIGGSRVRLRSRASGDPFFPGDFPEQIALVLTGQVYVAPVGTPGPTSINSALDPAFKDMGFLSDAGVTFADAVDVEPKSSWTSLYPADLVVTGRRVTVGFALREFNKRAVEFALEGTVAKSGTQWLHGAHNDSAVLKSLVIDAQDIFSRLRIYLPEGIVMADVESRLTRTTSVDLPVMFGVQTSATPYTLFRSGGN